MKKGFFLILITLFAAKSYAQQTIENPNDTRVITTGVPFLLIASDARAAGMADMGVATSADAYSQQWNAAKYAFATVEKGVAVTYTPYLSDLVNDIFLGNLTYYNRLNETSAFSLSLRYFSLGDIELRQNADDIPLIQSPNELTIDGAYSLRLSDHFAMSVGLRYLRSDLKIQGVDGETDAAGSIAADIGGFYQSDEKAYESFNGRWRAGFSIQNLGPKLKYDEQGQENFLPTNLRVGGGFDFIFDEHNKLGVTAEFNKLLVPTPPLLGFVDTNGDGIQTQDDPTTPDVDDNGIAITEGEAVDIIEDSGIDSNYSATYWPWLQMNDTENNQYLWLPPTLEVVRNIALTDNVAFPWFAAAGLNRGTTNAVKARVKLTLDERDTLYEGRINPMAPFSDVGVV
ncbi:MAG: type IX secretion system outer membrane channel protein PorV, partial [Flavobacteriaceae bacterium]|nr:type IX secretion system outer membrane channel protein PorV [Flavobacteriaceae bacterium]